MENKYYVPDITEFRIGFEYEIEMGGNWYLRDIPFYPLVDDSGLEYRVKYLDREDIESFGFEFDKKYEKFIIVNDSNDIVFLTMYSNYNSLIGKDYGMGCNETILFRGKIKNKSELQQVLKMVGVIE